MKIDYEGLIVLAAVVRTGSFDGAAHYLGVTQSAVSQRIKQLEDRVGSSLIVRGRPSRPTEEGLILCQHLEYVALLEDEMFDRLSGEGDEKRGTITVKICVNNDSLATWFPAVIRALSQKTRIRLEIVADDQEYTEDRLRSGDALAVVTSSDSPIPGSRSVALGNMEYMAIATPNYVDKYFHQGVTLEAIAAAPCITFDRKDNLPSSWVLLSFPEVPTLDTNYVPSFEGHLLCCRCDIGWAMMPTISVERLVAGGELVEIIPKKRINVPLYWQMRNQSSKVLNSLTSIVEAVASENLQSNVDQLGVDETKRIVQL